MKVTTEKGWLFDTEGGFAKSATEYAAEKGLNGIVVVLATAPDGEYREYVILKDNAPIENNQSFEAICVFIDMMAADKMFNEREKNL